MPVKTDIKYSATHNRESTPNDATDFYPDDSPDGDVDVGTDTAVYASAQDEKTMCPGCFSDAQIEVIGTLHIEGSPRAVQKCNSCSRIYSKTDGGIKQLIDEAKDKSGTNNVTYTPRSTGSNDNPTLSGVNEINIDYDTKSKIDNLNMQLVNVSGAVEGLVAQIQELVNANRDAMEKQKGDPMMGLRKSVFDFSLE